MPGREPKAGPALALALFDLDGTITRRDTYLAYLLGYLLRHPGRLLRAIPLSWAVALHFAGRRDNTWLKTTFLRAILGGVERASLQHWTEAFLDRTLRYGLRSRAREAIERHRAAGDRLLLVTASLDFYAEPLAERLGFDATICTRAAIDDAGRLTGALDGANCFGIDKLRCVERYRREHAPDAVLTFYTDHAADLPLIRYVDRAVLVNPTRRARRATAGCDITIEDWG